MREPQTRTKSQRERGVMALLMTKNTIHRGTRSIIKEPEWLRGGLYTCPASHGSSGYSGFSSLMRSDVDGGPPSGDV